MKNKIKRILPPFLYDAVKTLFKKSVPKPNWRTITEGPLKHLEIFIGESEPWQKRMLDGSYDKFIFDRLSVMNPVGKTIFDIGAHIGFHSFQFSKIVGEKGEVYAFEPNSHNFERFEMILKRNHGIRNIYQYKVAVSDMDGSVEFTTNSDVESGRSTGGFIEGSDTFYQKEVFYNKGFFNTTVRSVQIDHLESELGIKAKPNFIKIDVEGAEYKALKGAEETILEHKPILFIEIHSIEAMFDVVHFLYEKNYNADIIHRQENGQCFIEAKPKQK